MTPPLVEVQGLTRHFATRHRGLAERLLRGPTPIVRAVDGVDFTIGAGRTFGLVGESGSGKSTIARMLAGLIVPTTGSIRFDTTQLAPSADPARTWRPVRRRIQMVFQDPRASLDPSWRVRAIVAEPLWAFGLAAGRTAARRKVETLLAAVGLDPGVGGAFPGELSGGQRQRVAIARALASAPDLLVCDEPTSALDVSVQAQILNLLGDLQRELGLACLLISHDLAVVRQVASRVGVVYLGRLVETAPTESLLAAPRHPYTRMLLRSAPDLSAIGTGRPMMPGEPPDPRHPPSGCAFHPRCPMANDRCAAERPPARPSDDHTVACHAVEEGRAAPALPPWSSPP